MSFNPHLDEMTVPVYSPLHRRGWMVTPRQFRLICKLNGKRTTSQRQLAVETGYSIAGVHRAIESLVTGGIIGKLTRRGRKGWTRLVVRDGAHAMKAHESNVPELGTPSISEDNAFIGYGNISSISEVVARLGARIVPTSLAIHDEEIS